MRKLKKGGVEMKIFFGNKLFFGNKKKIIIAGLIFLFLIYNIPVIARAVKVFKEGYLPAGKFS